MRRFRETIMVLIIICATLVVMIELNIKLQIAALVVAVLTLFLIVGFRIWDWIYSEKGPKPLKAWFTKENFSEPYFKIKNPKIPIGKSELWYIVGPRIATEFEVINIRFVDLDRKASVLNVEFDKPIDFPKIKKREDDKKGGIEIVLSRPYRMIPPRQYLRMKLTVEGHRAGEDYINFRAPIGKGRSAKFAYASPQKVIIEKPISETEDYQHQ